MMIKDDDVACLEHHLHFLVFDLSWSAHHCAACLFSTNSLHVGVTDMMVISKMVISRMISSTSS